LQFKSVFNQGGFEMAISEKTKERLDDAGKEIKAAVDGLGKDVAELTKKVKERLKGTGEEMKETAEELSKEIKKLSERVKNIIPRKEKVSKLPVHVDKRPAIRSDDFEHPFLELRRATNRLFDDFSRGFGLSERFWSEPISLTSDVSGAQWPSVDMSETDNDVLITAELPGVNKDNLGISLSDSSINISGEKNEKEEDKGKDYYRLERSYGSFRRSFSLPCEIDEDKVDASFKNGVLKITLPKTEAARKRIKKIPVKSS
jgi:HSP20 family protein